MTKTEENQPDLGEEGVLDTVEPDEAEQETKSKKRQSESDDETPHDDVSTKKRKANLWDECYADLVVYQSSHGHCNVSHEDEPHLADWVSAQRKRREGSDKQVACAPLHPYQIERLNAIGFVWDTDQTGTEEDEAIERRDDSQVTHADEVIDSMPKRRGGKPFDHVRWKQMYELLSEYKQIHGDCLVRHNHEKLGTWVVKQRLVYRNGKMLRGREKLLNDIGFCWEPRVTTDTNETETEEDEAIENHDDCQVVHAVVNDGIPKRRGGRQPNDTQWMKMYESLSEYKRVNGDCLVRCDHKILGKWVARQRYENRKGRLRSDRKKLLDEVGFCWNRPPRKSRGANRKGSGVVRHKATAGRVAKMHSKVAAKTSAGDKATGHSASGEDVVHVDNSTSKCTQADHAKWKKKYELLLEYKRTHGDCLVRQDHKILGNWVRWQRRSNRIGGLLSSRKELLDEIGFCWDSRHITPQGNSSGTVRQRTASGRVAKRPAKGAAKTSASDEAKYPVGTPVNKFFVGHGWFTGEIKSYDGEYYKVTYADGDREEYDDNEIEDLVCSTPERGDKVSTRGQNKYAIGTTVRKNFIGHGRFNGSVTDYDEPLYGVTYEDGDKEELSEDALAKIVVKPDPTEVDIGSRVAVRWPRDGKFYEGTVVDERKHKKPWLVEYDEGTHEWLNFHWRRFHLLSTSCESRLSEEETSNDGSHAGADCDLSEVGVGSRLSVCDEANRYCEGTVTRHRIDKGHFHLKYDNGTREWIDLCQHKFRLLSG